MLLFSKGIPASPTKAQTRLERIAEIDLIIPLSTPDYAACIVDRGVSDTRSPLPGASIYYTNPVSQPFPVVFYFQNSSSPLCYTVVIPLLHAELYAQFSLFSRLRLRNYGYCSSVLCTPVHARGNHICIGGSGGMLGFSHDPFEYRMIPQPITCKTIVCYNED